MQEGTTITELGRKVAPPPRPRTTVSIVLRSILLGFALWFGIALFGLMILPDAIVSLVIIGVVFIGVPYYTREELIKNHQYKLAYPNLHAQWDHSFMCQRCATVFEPD